MNGLYRSMNAARKGSYFKENVQRVVLNYLLELSDLSEKVSGRKYRGEKGSFFTLNERGHERYVRSSAFKDRIIRHSFCDYILSPSIEPYLYWDNGASQIGKGLDFSRKNFEENLHRYYRKHRTNKGYVGFMDFSRYYDNILHDKCREMVGNVLPKDPLGFSVWLLGVILQDSRVDVSYMTDGEFASCLSEKFDSIMHSMKDPSLFTGEKFMEKSLSIGDQASQDLSIFYPTRIDNYFKTVNGVEFYGRYMDDLYIIHQDREYISGLFNGVRGEIESLGIYVNAHKTRILPLDRDFTYLQRKYRLLPTGKLVRRVNPKRVTSMRRKLKRYKNLELKGVMSFPEIEQAYKSWFGSHQKYMSDLQKKRLNALFDGLFIAPFRKGEYIYG